MKNKPVFLELFEGCYGLQRNGETVGPLEYDELGMITYKMSLSWFPSGRFSPEREGLVDIIEIIPAPEKLPEPFECEATFIDGKVNAIALGVMWNHAPQNAKGPFRCKVTPIERVK